MVETDGGASGRARRSARTHDPRRARLLARHRVPYRSRHALLLSVGRENRAVPDLHPSHPIFYNGSHHLWLVDPRFTCPTRCDTEAVRRGDSPSAGDAAGKLHHSQTPDNRLPVRRAAGPGFRLRWGTDARLWLTSVLSPMKSCCTWQICPIPPSRWNSIPSRTRAWRRWRVWIKARMEPLYGASAVLISANKAGTLPGIAAILPMREPKDRLERAASGAMRIAAPARSSLPVP